MKRIVSVSIGSSRGNKSVEVQYLGEVFRIERIGTDGDREKARQMIADLDGKVDAIGLGGIDLYLVAAGRRYTIRDALPLARAAKTTPVVDGSGLKAAWEPVVVHRLLERGLLHPQQQQRGIENLHVLLPSAVDRFGIAEALARATPHVIFGDFIFALGIPIRLTRRWQLYLAARTLLPFISKLPFEILYPTGSKQDTGNPKYRRFFDWADIIAGDKHFITKYMPSGQGKPLAGKCILTNTVRRHDIESFRERGLSRLITTTPELDGETLGTNAMQGVVVALLGKRPEEITDQEYVETIDRIGWRPWIVDL
jgi:hypothetical protein